MRTTELLQKTDVPEGKIGDWRIERFAVSENDAKWFNLRQTMSGYGRCITPGTYTRLMHGGPDPVMSDTPAEMRDHWAPVAEAKGHCLINGLGLAIVTEACLRKPEVDQVTVVEKSPEVIELMHEYLYERWPFSRLTIVNADALTFQPPKGVRYGMVWHDIWDVICSDNLEQMKTLHRRYGRRARWQGSWCRWMCERERRYA